MMALAAVFPLGIDGLHVHRRQFPVICQVQFKDAKQTDLIADSKNAKTEFQFMGFCNWK